MAATWRIVFTSLPHMEFKETTQTPHYWAARIVTFCVYMLLAIPEMADAGPFGVPFQFIAGAVISFTFVFTATFAGRVLQHKAIARIWYASDGVATVVLTVCAALLIFGRRLGFRITYTDEATGTYETLHPAVAYGCLFIIAFAILHFPIYKSSRRAV